MNKDMLPIYDKENCFLFALGRNAMYAACKILNLEAGDEVLTPAFDCDTALQPFRVLGLKLKFFRSDPHTFSVDIDDIKSQITSATRLVHVINHFGLPQPWNELCALREKTGIPILEDNAYSLFSRIDGKPFGMFGDMAIFSLRKNLPLAEGGLLRINNQQYKFKFTKRPKLFSFRQAYALWQIVKINLGFNRLFKPVKNMLSNFFSTLEPPPPLYSEEIEGYPAWPLRDVIGKEFSCDYLRPISRLARMQLNRFCNDDFAQIIHKKRKYYLWLTEKLSSIRGIKILWPELPEGIIPFCLCILIDKNRDYFFKTLRKKYDVMAWPTLSASVLEQLEMYPEVSLLGRKLLQINLLAEKVRSSHFVNYLDRLTHDIRRLSSQYL